MDAARPTSRSTGDQGPDGPIPAGRRRIGRSAHMTAMTSGTSTTVSKASQAGRSSHHCAVPIAGSGITLVG